MEPVQAVVDVEEGKSSTFQHSKYELIKAVNPEENSGRQQSAPPPDITWVRLSFCAGKTDILKDCWGKVKF